MKTRVTFGRDAQSALMGGIEIVAEAVGSTLGPLGRCVIIQQEDGTPHVTKDGVTVSKSLRLRDELQSLGAELVKEAASRTNDVAGDGTTTATVLAHSMCSEGQKLLAAGYSPKVLIDGIDQAVASVRDKVIGLASEVDPKGLYDIATISANGEKSVGKLVGDAITAVGKDGIVTVEETKGAETSIHVTEGLRIERGYVSPYFINESERMRCVLTDAYVLVTDSLLSSLQPIVPLLEGIHRNGKSLLIIADDIEGEAMKLLVVNKQQNGLKVCAIPAPLYDAGGQRAEFFRDVCSVVGARFITKGEDLEQMTLEDLGHADRIAVDKTTTVITAAKSGEAVKERAAEVTNQLADPTLDDVARAMVSDRLARLSGKAVVVRVGGPTEIELRERKDRVEDALNATRAAITMGVVPGGGYALFTAGESISPPATPGHGIVIEACKAPLSKIVSNAGFSSAVVIENMRKNPDCGFDPINNEYAPLADKGIIDPVQVTVTALENAASVAKAFITLSAAVVNDVTDDV